ncbi:MAG: ABC transporter ATP-binding protein [Actinomycetota bacterium]
MNDTPAIELAGVTKVYGERTVLDVDLVVQAGETLALLGPNGAGKSTATEICEGYRRPTTGTVRVLGAEPLTASAGWRARLGIVTQETGAFDRLTVTEAVRHLAGFFPDPLDVEEVLDLVELRPQADQLVDELSGGQRRRVDLACGLIGRPELLFLDEPTTGLDPEIRRRLWDVIADLRARGVTILLTTHYLDEAEALADRIAVIDNGRLIALDTPSALGGRSAAQAVVRYRPDSDRALAAARSLGASTDSEGRAELPTGEPGLLIARLVAEVGGDLPELTVTRPTLEDVYLRLVDHAEEVS